MRKTILFWIRRNEETGGDLTPHHRHLYQRATTAEQDGAIVAAHSANPFHSTALSAADYNEEAREELNKKEKKDDDDALEAVLHHIGEMGRYQWFLFFAMMPFCVAFAFVYFVQMFIAATPRDHWCKIPELQGLPLDVRRNLSIPKGEEWQQCFTYAANWSLVLETLEPPDPQTALTPCAHGWEFLLTDIPYETVISERGWVCQYAGYGPMAQAAFFVGSLFGGLLFGWQADLYGRVPALICTCVTGIVGAVATTFTTSFWDFALARFIAGMTMDSCMMMIYILVLEYVGPKYRTWVANMAIALFFGGGCIALPWLALWIGDWRQLLYYTALPFCACFAVPFVVPESARWLAHKGRVDQAVKYLKRFEKINGTKIPPEVLDDFILSARQTRETDESLLALFRSPWLRRMFALMVGAYMVNALVFDGLVRMSEGLGFDFFITFTLQSATEVPSVTLLALILDKFGRRWLMCGPMVIAGVLTLIGVFVPKGIAVVTLAILARFCINMAYNTGIQWVTEFLPTPVRASGSSLIHVAGCLATVVSPFVVYSEHLWVKLPILILGVSSLAGAAMGLWLPETNGRPMPQSMADGEAMCKEYSLWRQIRSKRKWESDNLGDTKLQTLVTT